MPADTGPLTAQNTTELLVCTKCRAGQDIPEDGQRPGQRMYDALAAADLPNGVRLRAVDCMQNCDAGCTFALRGAGKWTYVFGKLTDVSQLDAVLEGAALYHQSEDGLIPWRQRPEHFKRNCVARIPALEVSDD